MELPVCTFSQNCVVLFVFLLLRNIQHWKYTNCLYGSMEKSAGWFNLFVNENKNSRWDERKLTFCNKAVDQATAHQHLKTCRRYAIYWRKIICMIIIMELWIQRQLADCNKWSFSNRWHTFCMFSNVDVLLLGQQFCCETLTSIHPVLNSCFHLQTCWIIVHPSPYTHTNNSYISSDVYFSAVRKQITLHNSDWMYVYPGSSMFTN